MDLSVLITGIIGLCTTIASGWVSWFFTRKKYYSEVDNNVIENMEKSLEFYKKLSDDNTARLEDMITRNAALEAEVQDLKDKVFNLTMNICMSLSCASRIKEIKSEESSGEVQE